MSSYKFSMPSFRNMVMGVLALLLLISVPVDAKVRSKQMSNEVSKDMTWEVFAGGCIEKNKNLDSWANKQIYLRKAQIKNKKRFAGLWKNLGYPVPDKLKNLWGAVGKQVWLYQHENNGCTVTTHAYISRKMVERAFNNVGKAFKAKAGLQYKVKAVSSASKKSSVVLLVIGPNKKKKTYMMARILPKNKSGIRTILYLFKTNKNVNI